jgi:uncharacterized protein (TIGR03067 family)
MRRTIAGVVICVAVTTSYAGEDEAAQELKRLEGVWASTPAKEGRDRGHVLVFQGGRMFWRSFQTQDGEPVIGHAKLYDIRVDPKASPKRFTATRGEGDDRETRRALYELDGDTLKVAFSSGLDGEWPKSFKDPIAPVITLKRNKDAKVPDLTKAGKETRVEPRAAWFGQSRDAELAKQCPEKPITTRAEFERVWKVLRGKEEVPAVDFEKEFALVRTSTTTKVTKVELVVVEGADKVDELDTVTLSPDEKAEGFRYAIFVFRREHVDVVDGRIVPKAQKK